MEEYKLCEVCGAPYSEEHHIVYRSHAKYMEHVPVNKIFLCYQHHKYDKKRAPHKNGAIDLEYKRKLQAKLIKMFDKDYYTSNEIKEKLGVSANVVRAITKTLTQGKEGYKKSELIFHMMGDKNYDTCD